MKKALSIILTLCLCFSGFALPVIDPELRSAMERYSNSDRIEIVVLMKAQYDRQ